MAETVGSRELKTRLGTYLRRVESGETIIVTQRGRPVAELRPLQLGDEDDRVTRRLLELERLGVISWAGAQKEPIAFEPLEIPGLDLSSAIQDDREDRG